MCIRRCELFQMLLDCLAGRGRLPENLAEPPHPDATLETQRSLERRIEQRLGSGRRGSGSAT